jgi:hypothetical protein
MKMGVQGERRCQEDRLAITDAELSQRLQPLLNQGDGLIEVDIQRQPDLRVRAPPAPRWPARSKTTAGPAKRGADQFWAIKRPSPTITTSVKIDPSGQHRS